MDPHNAVAGGPSRSAGETVDDGEEHHVELLARSRSKRSTAGNRMRALLDQEIEKEELFEEVEDDVDFEEQRDEEDIIDSDFDRSSGDEDGAGADYDSDAGERELEAQEKAARKASRARAVPMHIRRPAIRPQPAPAAALSRSIEPSAATKPSAEAGDIDQDDTTADAAGRPDRAAKRRRISFASNAASGTVAGEISKDGVRTSSRKATVRNKRETQEKLREAEERKLAQPQRAPKPRRPQLTQDALIAEALETEERNRESLREFLEREEERKARLRGSGKPRIEGAFIRWKSVGIESRQRLVRLVEDRAALPSNSAPGEGAGPSVLPDVGGDQHPKGVQSNEALVNGSASTPSIPAVTAVPDAPKDGNPVAVHERSAGPGSADQKDGVDSVLTQPRSPEIERHARTLLSVHSLPEDATWVDEFEAIFGTHCHWDALPIVPARNRPLRPRQSTCALTGLPALYKDPRTGIPYANAGAYKTLTELLEDRFVWTGVPPSETGSAPIGYYAIREDDAGAADVFVEPPMPVESTLATGQDPSELPLPDLESGENLGSASTPTTSRSGRRTSGRMKAPVA